MMSNTFEKLNTLTKIAIGEVERPLRQFHHFPPMAMIFGESRALRLDMVMPPSGVVTDIHNERFARAVRCTAALERASGVLSTVEASLALGVADEAPAERVVMVRLETVAGYWASFSPIVRDCQGAFVRVAPVIASQFAVRSQEEDGAFSNFLPSLAIEPGDEAHAELLRVARETKAALQDAFLESAY